MKKILMKLFLLVLNLAFIKSMTTVNLCNSFNPCKNLGTCSLSEEEPHRIKCNCARGFTGSLCEIWPKVCSSDFCLNEGTCVQIKKIPRCLCPPGYNGMFCERLTYTIINNQTSEEIIETTNLQETTTSTTTTTPVLSTTQQITTDTSTQSIFEIESTTDYVHYPSISENPKSLAIKDSICDYEPCLNSGHCFDTNTIGSIFKFYCVCPQSYAGVLCENYIGDIAEAKNQEYYQLTDPIQQPELQTNSQVYETTTAINENLSLYNFREYSTESITTTPVTTQTILETKQITTKQKSICVLMRPCANNGQCVEIEPTSEDPRRFKCVCTADYTGTYCHIKVFKRPNSICSINPCLNSGICVASNDNLTYTCTCPSNFTGKFCELNYTY